MLYTFLLMHPLFLLTKTFYETRNFEVDIYYSVIDPKYYKIPFFFNIDFLFRCFINLNTGEAVLNIIGQASGFTKLIFMGWKTRNPVSSPIPEHENSRFWLVRDKFVIVEAILNIIVQATAFARVFFSTWRFKKWKSNWLPQNRVFLTTLIMVVTW